MRACTLMACLAAVSTGFAAPAPARAGCTTIDFDDLVAGTVVSNQYPGVVFSAHYGGGSWSNPIIYNPNGSTSSVPYCLSARGDAQNEFSEEYLRMTFDRDQTEVTFSIGVRSGCTANDTVQVRAYDDGGALVETQNIPVNGTSPTEQCRTAVRIEREAGFRRVEVEAGAAGGCAARFELIDDVSFDSDTTPPTAEITSPAQLACVCSGVAITGSAYDPDGPIKEWRLHRKAIGATTWTLIAVNAGEVINGLLANWIPSASAGDGYYTLRLTVTNACDMVTTWTTEVWLDRAFNSLSLRSPWNGAIVGGTVCADGTAWDHCGGSFTVTHRPAVGGSRQPFDVINPPWVITDLLGSWNTRGGTADGDYVIELSATDDCGNTASASANVTVDNTEPIAVITWPHACLCVDEKIKVIGTANDAHLDNWVLQYAGGDAVDWITISSGTRPVINGGLGDWSLAGLRPCAYALRLVVTDKAVIDCNSGAHNRAEYVVSVNVGNCDPSSADLDRDGDVDLDDFGEFQACFNGPNRPPACP